MRSKSLFHLLLLLAVFLLPLGVRPLFSPDETRYAEIAREMLESGDWVVPRLNGTCYFEKPILGYWFFAGSMKLFGRNAFALRLPSALSMVLCAAFLVLLMRSFRAGPRESLLAGVIFFTMPMNLMLGGIGVLDGMFSLFMTLCIGTFFIAYERVPKLNRKLLLYALAGAFAGAAFLIKGFLAFALPGLSILAYLLWCKRWKDIFLLPWIPLFAALLIIAPWGWAIHRADPDFWHYFVVVEHWQRFFGGESAQHPEPFYFFLPFLLAGTSIWIPFLPAVVVGLKNTVFRLPLLRFCFCWFLLPLVFLSCSSGKLASYILPCFPPISILAAAGLAEWTRSRKIRALPKWIAILVMCGLGIFLAVAAINFLAGFPVRSLLLKHEAWMWLLLTVCGLFSILALAALLSEKNTWRQMRWYVLAIVPVILCLQCILPQYFVERRCPVFTLSSAPPVSPEQILVSFRYPFQDVCWFYRRSDVYILASPGEIEYGLKRPDQKHRLLSVQDFNALVREKRTDPGVVLVMATDRFLESREKGRLTEKPSEEIHGPDGDCTSIVYYR